MIYKSIKHLYCFDKYEQDRNGRKTMASVFLTTGLIVSNLI